MTQFSEDRKGVCVENSKWDSNSQLLEHKQSTIFLVLQFYQEFSYFSLSTMS